MRIAILQFPGTNCERETMLAVERAGMIPVEFLWNESADVLKEMDGYILAGGFSYEDRSRAGIIAALDPIMLIIADAASQGKPVLGICNGAQVLVETGLVPGLENNKIAMALADNKRVQDGKVLGTGFYNDWVNIRVSDHYQRNAFTRHLKPTDILRVPVAHAEGRFVMSEALLKEIQEQGLDVFQYCNEQGELIEDFPVNPNGSVCNIAAVSNKAGNVMAMMPHPERTSVGDRLFASMRDYIAKGHFTPVEPLHYYPRFQAPKKYVIPSEATACVVDTLITDNQAITVENTLKRHGFAVRVARQLYWELQGVNASDFERIKQTGVLFNSRKEAENKQPLASQAAFLVRAKEDWQGAMCLQTLRDHFAIQGVEAVHFGVIWHIFSETPMDEAAINKLLNTHIFYNPYAHDYYRYN